MSFTKGRGQGEAPAFPQQAGVAQGNCPDTSGTALTDSC